MTQELIERTKMRVIPPNTQALLDSLAETISEEFAGKYKFCYEDDQTIIYDYEYEVEFEGKDYSVECDLSVYATYDNERDELGWLHEWWEVTGVEVDIKKVWVLDEIENEFKELYNIKEYEKAS